MPATTGFYPELVEEPALSLSKGLPHTFACSTIGPAGLNLRALCGRERSGSPAAEILSVLGGVDCCLVSK